MRLSRTLLIIVGILSLPISLMVLNIHWKKGSHPPLASSVDTSAEVVQDEDGEATGAAVVSDEAPAEAPVDESVAAKRKKVMGLVQDGLAYIEKNNLDDALNSFTHTDEFIRGELYLFVYDLDGVCLANGQDAESVWKNQHNIQDSFGMFIVQEMLKKGKEGGGWLTYQWRNATKVAYIKQFTKDGYDYIIGSGYYPHSKVDLVASFVKGAAAYFNDVVIKHGLLSDEVFSTFSYPAGRFVAGDLYLYAVSFDGTIMANGDRPGLVGSSVFQVDDVGGRAVNEEIIKKLKEGSHGVWVEYNSKNTRKKVYAERVTDAKGKDYFIACGYYPSVTPEKAIDLVKSGYEFLKKHGLSAAVSEFTDRRSDQYRFGELYLFVYDSKGNVIAHGGNPDLIGMNQWDVKDEDGKYYVRELIDKAKKGGGWADLKMKGAFESVYVEQVDLGTDSYIIGTGVYPVSRHETALLLARSAASYLRTHVDEEAFGEFTNADGKFIRGDLNVFVVEFNGICNVWGDNHDMIWRNILNATDDNNKPYIQIFINTVKQGAGQVTYKIHGHERVALLEMVDKGAYKYVVGTGYYV